MNSRYCFGIIIMLAGAPQAQLMHGTITDAVTGKPIPGAAIRVNEIEKTCTTDSAGYYNTGIVPAGIFNATITAKDYLMAFRKVFIAWPKGRGLCTIKFSTVLYRISSAADTTKGKMSLTYRFPGQGDIEIAIKNGIGKIIRKMYDRSRAGGMRTFSWNGKDDEGNMVPPGRYLCKVSSGRFVIIRTLEWKGETVVPPAVEPPAEVPPPYDTAVVPAAVTEVPPKAEETPAGPPAIPPTDTITPAKAPAAPGE